MTNTEQTVQEAGEAYKSALGEVGRCARKRAKASKALDATIFAFNCAMDKCGEAETALKDAASGTSADGPIACKK